jgi:hypothetical protein
MTSLTISLAYRTDGFARRRGVAKGLALPAKVLDVDGSVVAEGVVSVDAPVTLEVPETTGLAFVRLTWPSGRFVTQRVDLEKVPHLSVTFQDSHIAPGERWSAWAIPKLNPRTPLANPTEDIDLGLDRFANVWLRLWKFDRGAWLPEPLEPEATYRNKAAWQFDLTLEARPWLLQIGGPLVRWRFVSLPGDGPARVLITPKDSTDPRADELKVIVTSFREDAETLLEFLARDAMDAVHALAESASLANELIAHKIDDPVSAVAAAYYLLRVNAWSGVPLERFQNLSKRFPWLPDAAIVHCIRLLREGSDAQDSDLLSHQLFVQALQRGWPLYSEGVTLLQEAATSLRGTFASSDRESFEHVHALGAAKAWAGAVASFYGRSPEAPSTVHWLGMPDPPSGGIDPAMMVPRPPSGGASPGFAQGRLPGNNTTGVLTLRAGKPDEDIFLLGSIKQ